MSDSEASPGSTTVDHEGADSGLQRCTFGGGCFWCLEAVYQEMEGVRSVQSGYAGGHTEDPSYRQVCAGATGHAEVVQLEYDRSVTSFREILRVFFTIHDPTTKDRQGADRGPQYRSIILHHSPEQERVAREVMAEVEEAGLWDDPLVTELEPLERFWPAEPEHDDYYQRNPRQPYCVFVVGPKVQKFRTSFPEKRAASG